MFSVLLMSLRMLLHNSSARNCWVAETIYQQLPLCATTASTKRIWVYQVSCLQYNVKLWQAEKLPPGGRWARPSEQKTTCGLNVSGQNGTIEQRIYMLSSPSWNSSLTKFYLVRELFCGWREKRTCQPPSPILHPFIYSLFNFRNCIKRGTPPFLYDTWTLIFIIPRRSKSRFSCKTLMTLRRPLWM